MKIIVLVENSAEKPLRAEHGFSCWIEVAGKRILFDTGQGDALIHNANALGIDLSTADALVLSHGHYDHTGALAQVLALNPTLPIYAHPDVLIERYSIHTPGEPKPIGMPLASRAALAALPTDQIHWIREPVEIFPNIGLTGPIPRETNFEDTGGPFFLDPEGQRPDPIRDDQALWLKTDHGLVVIAGCSHAGIINTLSAVRMYSGETTLHTVIGGFHLKHASVARLEATAAAFEDMDVEQIVPCHCTGEAPVSFLESRMGARIRTCSAGSFFMI